MAGTPLEKMLCDDVLLNRLYLRAFQAAGEIAAVGSLAPLPRRNRCACRLSPRRMEWIGRN
jgi:hypothetical protein